MTAPFVYPEAPLVRRHDPQGYAGYASYLPFLRDDFAFRCVYCLHRERWVPGGFHIDHFAPVALHPGWATRYDNLFYSCASCNLGKRDAVIPDPGQSLLRAAVSVQPDGTMTAGTPEALSVIEHLHLNGSHYVAFRRVWIRIVEILSTSRPDALPEILGFPDDLPDLSKLRPPGGNAKPDGIEQSHFRRRERGELPDTY